MSNESVEVQLARIDERWQSVVHELELSRNTRKTHYDSIEAINLALQDMRSRVMSIEKQVATAQPTIEEFITIKHKVVGAGQIGKWLWISGAFLLGLVASSREAVLNFFKVS